MRRISGKVSQITRITQSPSGQHLIGLGSLRSRGLSQITRIPQISQIGFAALIRFHKFH